MFNKTIISLKRIVENIYLLLYFHKSQHFVISFAITLTVLPLNAGRWQGTSAFQRLSFLSKPSLRWALSEVI